MPELPVVRSPLASPWHSALSFYQWQVQAQKEAAPGRKFTMAVTSQIQGNWAKFSKCVHAFQPNKASCFLPPHDYRKTVWEKDCGAHSTTMPNNNKGTKVQSPHRKAQHTLPGILPLEQNPRTLMKLICLRESRPSPDQMMHSPFKAGLLFYHHHKSQDRTKCLAASDLYNIAHELSFQSALTWMTNLCVPSPCLLTH